MKLKPIALSLLLLSLLILLVLAALAFLPIPGTVRVNAHDASGQIVASRGFVLNNGDCVTLRWNVQNIRTITLNDAGVVGTGEQEACVYADAPPTLTIQFTDDAQISYRAPVTVLSASGVAWGALVVAVLALIAAGVVQVVPSEPRTTTTGAVGRLWNTTVLIFMSTVISLGVLEGALRLYFSVLGSERDQLIYLGSGEDITAANSTTIAMPFVNFGGVPGKRDTNQRGFRNPDVADPKPEGVYRILALGGSTTYGLDVPAEQSYPSQLQAILRDDYGYANVEVINGGFPSYTTMNSLANFVTRGIEMQPDLVIVYHANNDLVRRWDHPDCYNGENPLNGFGGDPGLWQDTAPTMHPFTTVRVVQYSLGLVPNPASFEWQLRFSDLCDRSAPYPSHIDRINANPPTFYERNLRNFVYLARGNNMDIFIPTQAYDTELVRDIVDGGRDNLDQWASVIQGMGEHNGIIRQIADENPDMLFYDFAAEFPYEATLWSDYIHLNAAGMRLQAEAFAAYLDGTGVIR